MDIKDKQDQSLRLTDPLKVVESLKQVVVIVTGITITNCVVIFLTNGDYTKIRDYTNLSLNSFLYFFLILANVIRFYHGNMRLLDEVYKPNMLTKQRNLGADFFVIFGQSILYAAMSFYINKEVEFFGIFTILLFSDVVWFVFTVVDSLGRFDEAGIIRQRNWAINNITFCVLLFISFFFISSLQNIILYIQFSLVIVNTLISYYLNWHYFFPSQLKLH